MHGREIGCQKNIRILIRLSDSILLYSEWTGVHGISEFCFYCKQYKNCVCEQILLMETEESALFVRAKPCLPLWSFSLIRKTELWKTNKPPAMQVSQHCFSLQKKTSGGIINVGSPTALIYTGGIHMDNNSLSHTKWNCKYHIGATCGRCLKCAHALSPPFVIFLPRNA